MTSDRVLRNYNQTERHVSEGRAEMECDGTRKRTGGEVKGERMEGVASSRALYPTRSIQHYYR